MTIDSAVPPRSSPLKPPPLAGAALSTLPPLVGAALSTLPPLVGGTEGGVAPPGAPEGRTRGAGSPASAAPHPTRLRIVAGCTEARPAGRSSSSAPRTRSEVVAVSSNSVGDPYERRCLRTSCLHGPVDLRLACWACSTLLRRSSGRPVSWRSPCSWRSGSGSPSANRLCGTACPGRAHCSG